MKTTPANKDEKLYQDFENKDLRALSRLITLSENRDYSILPYLEKIYQESGKSKVIGMTGVPGAGKSTLINFFIRFFREQNENVAVLAVDPMSPFTGGSLLGDRIRLTDHFNDKEVYIRSLSTRGKLGGLTAATRESLLLLQAFGFKNIILETVGVGQSEVDVKKLVDATMVVLVPEWGDSVQALKAGILEIADLFVVNKCDRDGADRVAMELKSLLDISKKTEVSVMQTSSSDLESIKTLFNKVTELTAVKSKAKENHAKETASEFLQGYLDLELKDWFQSLKQENSQNPYQIVNRFIQKFPVGSLFKK